MKRLLLTFLLLTAISGLWATQNPNALIVLKKDGSKVGFLLKEKPTIGLATDVITITVKSESVTYPMDAVSRFYFADDVNSIDDTKLEAEYSIADGKVTVNGIEAGQTIEAFDASGRRMASAKAGKSGKASLKLGEGVFIIKSGTNSFKVKL